MPSSIQDHVAAATARLRDLEVPNAQKDAELLLSAVLQKDRAYLMAFGEHPLTAEQASLFDAHIDRRAAREPVSRILGWREFWSLSFEVTPHTLDPRPDTEILVEKALALYPTGVDGFVDVGTGTGCIAIALLTEWPDARAIVTDIDPDTLAVTQRNADRLGVGDRLDARLGSWLSPVTEKVPLIVSNPPYIARSEVLDPEVALYDPDAALFAESDGLAAHETLWSQAAQRLKPGGHAVMEIGWQQKQVVEALARGAGFHTVGTTMDLGGRDRVVYGTHLSGE